MTNIPPTCYVASSASSQIVQALGSRALAEKLARVANSDSDDSDDESSGAKQKLMGASSVAKKYVVDLSALMETLDVCQLHYVRCFKPNLDQKAGKWQGQIILDQMEQSGGVDLVGLGGIGAGSGITHSTGCIIALLTHPPLHHKGRASSRPPPRDHAPRPPLQPPPAADRLVGRERPVDPTC